MAASPTSAPHTIRSTVPSANGVSPISSNQRGRTKKKYRTAAMTANDACHSTAPVRRMLLLDRP